MNLHFRHSAAASVFRGVGVLRGLAAVFAFGIVSAGTAWAQPSDPLPPGTVTLGPFRITPSLVLREMGVDDNVFNESTDPKRDFTFTLTPRADVLFRMRRLRLSYTTVTDYVYYRTYKSERGTNTSSSARLEFDLGSLKPYVTATGLNSKNRLNAEVDERARHRDVVYQAGVSLRLASRTTLLLSGLQGKVAYEPDARKFRGVDLRESFNGTKRSIDAGLGVALTPITTFTMGVSREEQRYRFSQNRDADSWRISPSFAFTPGGLLSGSATVGYRRFHTLSPTLPDYRGVVGAATVAATLFARHHLAGTFSRDVQTSYDVGTAYYLGTGATLTYTVRLAGPIDARGTGARQRMDYSISGVPVGRDLLTSYGGGIGYRFSDHARLGVNAEWSRRGSDREFERTYRNHRIFAGLTWGLTL